VTHSHKCFSSYWSLLVQERNELTLLAISVEYVDVVAARSDCLVCAEQL